MGFRFWRRVRLVPGVTLNLSKSGGSLSFGPRGAKFTVGPRGKRMTAGIPGTGLFYSEKVSEKAGGGRRRRSEGGSSSPAGRAAAQKQRLSLGFFQRLVTPAGEEALVDGCRELALGNEDQAYEHLCNAAHLADGAYLAGLLALRRSDPVRAVGFLKRALKRQEHLGRHFAEYGIAAGTMLQVTEELCAEVGPDLRGVLLALVEGCQCLERWDEALTYLEQLRQLEPGDVVVRLSLAEVLLESPGDREACRKAVRLAEGVENESPVHAALLLCKARALRGLGLPEAAREMLKLVLRRRKGRPPELLRAARYERALLYEDLGQRSRARKDLERIYAEDSCYEDVARRLGL